MHLIQATSREIREEYEALYLKRKKFEKSTPVFSYPLPWTPGQSLISMPTGSVAEPVRAGTFWSEPEPV